MIEDAKSLSAGARIRADVCIVGSGPAGMTVAMGLAGSGLRVILLESGGLAYEPDTAQLLDGEIDGLPRDRLLSCRIRALGGTSGHWAGWCRPLDASDMSGWPIGRDALQPFYERAHRTLELGDYHYDVAAVSEKTGLPYLQTDPSRVETVMYQHSPPTRFGTRYRQEVDDGPDVKVYLHANVLSLDVGGGEIRGLDCSTLDGTTFRVDADRVVLAAGAIENARLLLASGVGDPDVVGAGFCEHPHYYRGAVALLRPDLDLRAYGYHNVDLGKQTRVSYGLSIPAELRAAEGVQPLAVTLRMAKKIPVGALQAEAVRSVMVDAPPGYQLRWVVMMMGQTWMPESRVGLSDRTDAFGMPLPSLRWAVTDSDLDGLVRAYEIIGAELARAKLGRLWVRSTSSEDYRALVNGGCHHMGTTRMATDTAPGVVNSDCRMLDVGNLYVAGSSVFATTGSAHPTLTIVALAHRLADHLSAA